MHRTLFALLVLGVLGCGGASAPTRSPTDPAPATGGEAAATGEDEARWQAWRETRRESLAGEDGWLSLIALAWLEHGEITLGSDPASGIVLPADRAPARIGRFVVTDVVRFVAEPGVEVTSDGEPATDVIVHVDLGGEPTHLAIGTLRMHVIERAGRLGLRVRDQASPAREHFEGVPVYDYDPAYRVRARVAPCDPPRMLGIVNVLGMQVDEECAAIVSFELDGASISLAATENGPEPEDGLFLMLRDTTASEGQTYPAGRYLEVAGPDANGETWVDLNYLYTPPCGYTTFATCPLPPVENELAIPLRAGERFLATH